MTRTVIVSAIVALSVAATGVGAAPGTQRPIKPTKAKAVALTRAAIIKRWPLMYPLNDPSIGLTGTLRVGCSLIDPRLYRCNWTGESTTAGLYHLTRTGKSKVRFYRYAGDARLYDVRCKYEDLTSFGLPTDPCER